MSSQVVIWLFFRAARWLSWIVFIAWAIHVSLDRAPYMTGFGQLTHGAEAMFFVPPLLAVLFGFLELMMREKNGFERPRFGQIIPQKVAEASAPTRLDLHGGRG
jgi:hypothetical protein